MLDHISVSIAGTVWAVMHDKIYYRGGVTPNNEQGSSWNPVQHDFSVALLEAGGWCVWTYSRHNTLHVRTGMTHGQPSSSITSRIGVGWEEINSPSCGITDMALTALDDLFVLTDDSKLFKRDGCTQSCPQGVNWAKVSLPRLGGGGFLGLGATYQVIRIAGGLHFLWAVTDSHEVWRAPYGGVITESSWQRIPGQKMTYVCPSMCDQEITWGINNRDQIFVRSSPQVGRYEWLRQGTIIFSTVSVGVLSNYAMPSEHKANSTVLARSVSVNNALDMDSSRELKVTDMPFKMEECEEMSGELLNALVIPVLNREEILQRFNYDFTTEMEILNDGVR